MMNRLASVVLAFSALPCAYAQVVGHAVEMTKTCYVRADKDAQPRPLQRGMDVSLGEEIACSPDARVAIELTSGETRSYEAVWTPVGGVASRMKRSTAPYIPHVESASADDERTGKTASKKAAKAMAKVRRENSKEAEIK